MDNQKLIDKLDELHTILAKSEINAKTYKKASCLLLEVKQELRQHDVSGSPIDYYKSEGSAFYWGD